MGTWRSHRGHSNWLSDRLSVTLQRGQINILSGADIMTGTKPQMRPRAAQGEVPIDPHASEICAHRLDVQTRTKNDEPLHKPEVLA
jgi:hypothetical protein